MVKDLLRDMLEYAPGQIIPGIIGFISIPIFTRLFLPDDYGNYILVTATVSILVTMVGWLSTSIIRFYPAFEKENKLDIFYSTIVNLAFISIGMLTIIYLVVLWALKNNLNSRLYSLLLIGALLFVVQGLFNVLQYLLRAKRKINWYTTFAVGSSTASLCLGLLLVIVFDHGVEGLLFGSFLGILLSLPFLWHISSDTMHASIRIISKDLASDMAKYGLPLVTANLAAWILSLSDRYVLEFFFGSKEVGLYSASYGIAERSIIFINTLFMLAAGPISMSIWEKAGVKASQEFITKLTRYYLLVCFPAIVGLSVLSKPIISLLTPQMYHEGFIIIPFVALGAFFLGLQQCFQSGLLFYKRTPFVMTCVIISGALNLFLNLLFVPYYGYKAAAITTLISYFSLLLLMIIGTRKIFTWAFPFKTLWKVIYASTIMGFIVYYISNCLAYQTLTSLIIGVILGMLTYFILLFIFREFQRDEKEAIKNFIKPIKFY